MKHNIDRDFTGTKIIHGDLLRVLPTFPGKLFGGIVCDPPYASGAADQNAKQKSTGAKYSSAKTNSTLPDFEGDSKDQRSWTHWMNRMAVRSEARYQRRRANLHVYRLAAASVNDRRASVGGLDLARRSGLG
jgi:DNA modification methylase